MDQICFSCGPHVARCGIRFQIDVFDQHSYFTVRNCFTLKYTTQMVKYYTLKLYRLTNSRNLVFIFYLLFSIVDVLKMGCEIKTAYY